MRRASVAEVLDTADRQARPLRPQEPPLVALDPPLIMGWRWDGFDAIDERWFPQGITTSHDAMAGGRWRGREIVLVSWAFEGHRGARVTFAELRGDAAPRYRHVRLAVPQRGVLGPSLAPVRVHAGGIAWHGETLWVADTLRGLRAFSLELILQSPDGEYVMPQVGAHRLAPWEVAFGPRFSFLSLSRDERGEAYLLSGEYRDRRPGGRLVAWPPPSAGEAVRARSVERAAETNLQGALSLGSAGLRASSAGLRAGRLAVHGPEPVTRRWAVGPEDLTLVSGRDLVLSLTERPEGSCESCGRVVFGVALADLIGER